MHIMENFEIDDSFGIYNHQYLDPIIGLCWHGLVRNAAGSIVSLKNYYRGHYYHDILIGYEYGNYTQHIRNMSGAFFGEVLRLNRKNNRIIK